MSCRPERVKLRRKSVLKVPCHCLPFHPAFLRKVGWCVLVCPIILDMLSIGTPFSRVTIVANVRLAIRLPNVLMMPDSAAISTRYSFMFWLLGTGRSEPLLRKTLLMVCLSIAQRSFAIAEPTILP